MFVIIPGVPILMYQYTVDSWLGSILTFFVVTCLCGLHEVSRELENPFRKPPNEIPVCTLQAQFNEALLTAYAGYHPDAYFTDDQCRRRATVRSSLSPSANSVSERSLSSRGIILEGNEGAGTDDEDEGIELSTETAEEIREIQSEMDEHAREMQRLRKTLDEKIKGRLSQKMASARKARSSSHFKLSRDEEPVG
jgi:hypothetical protein